MNIIEEHIEKILEKYTQGDYYDLLLKAKEQYVDATGKLNEETDEYESRMNTFNDWFIFHFKMDNDRRVIDDYIQDSNLEADLSKAFYDVNYSLFHYVKVNFRKQVVLKDILHNQKLILAKDNGEVSLVADDIFVGRTITYKDQSYLMRGLCFLPRTVLGSLKKEAKKVRKLNNITEEERYLLKIESLMTRSLNYGHIDASKIFIFS
jgi:hypothetical protein